MKKFLIATTAVMLAGGAAIAQVNNLQPPVKYVSDYVPKAGETAFDFKLKGYVFGIRMIKARFKGQYGAGNYSAYSDMKTSGLAALIKKQRLWATTDGRYDQSGYYPLTHTQQNLDKKMRRVEMRYDYDAQHVSWDIRPPNGSRGKPPATVEEAFTADDIPSALLNMLSRGYAVGGNLCDGTIRVFDSKQHYGLRMVKVGTDRIKFDGEKRDTVRCHVFYEPINGFDPEDLPNAEEANTPVNVYFWERPDLGMSIPVRFTYRISVIKAVIKLDEMSVVKG